MRFEVAPLVELAALDHSQVSQHVLDGLADPFAAVDDAQDPPVQLEPAADEVLQ